MRSVKLTRRLDTTYLDHAGTTLYPKSLIDAFSADMMSNLLGNPHSASTSSQSSTQRINDIRLRALRLFNADPDHFDLIFVANATAGIKLVADGFREAKGGFWYGYYKDSHTSLVGVREIAKAGRCFTSDEEVDEWLEQDTDQDTTCAARLFAYPAQSNMNGRRLPLAWTRRLRSRHGASYSLLDAAALVSTTPLDLGDAAGAPDFTVLSFYKMFGFPDLGALIVRKDSGPALLERRYFGGGTVEMVTCGKENWHSKKRMSLHEQLEDGTLPLHNILALGNAMDVHSRLFGSFEHIASHTAFLAQSLYKGLASLRHRNGSVVCDVYNDCATYNDTTIQGPIVAFNLRDCNGDWVSNTEVEKLANLRNIHLRTGGLCNPGGIASALKLQPWEMKRNFSAGQRCGGENDILGGKPTGVIRASLGAMSTMQDIDTFLAFLREFFVDQDEVQVSPKLTTSDRDLYIETLTVYLIKSCGGWSVPFDQPWEVKDEGLAWDREWCLIHQGTRSALSQKKYPIMALLRPSLDFNRGLLHVRFHGPIPPGISAEVSVPLSADPTVFQRDCSFDKASSQVCEDSVVLQTYASQEIADFFTTLIDTPCTLARFPPAKGNSSMRHTKSHLSNLSNKKKPILLSNESPILTISRSSLNRLNEQIKAKGGKAAHASVFRANIVVAEDSIPSSGPETPFAEDSWRSLRIGDEISLDVLGGCRRCQMVSVDQHSAERNEEPFVTLAKTRRREGKVFFGVHTALADCGKKQGVRIKVGDKVTPVGVESE